MHYFSIAMEPNSPKLSGFARTAISLPTVLWVGESGKAQLDSPLDPCGVLWIQLRICGHVVSAGSWLVSGGLRHMSEASAGMARTAGMSEPLSTGSLSA